MRAKLLKKIRPKFFGGSPVTGPVLVQLAQAYVAALNEGHVPVIENAWNFVCEAEAERGFREASEELTRKTASLRELLPIGKD